MSEKPAKPGLTRKSAFSCEACRKRKVKCNGANPSCSRCAARGETCIYSLTPTLSYTKTLEARVAELETALANLQGGTGNIDGGLGQEISQQHQQQQMHVDEPRENLLRTGVSHGVDNIEHIPSDLARGIDRLKIGDDGRISIYGPTSLFQLPSSLAPEEANPLLPAAAELDSRKERLINNAWRERAFEQLATIPDPFQYLLDSHWCWIHPLYNFVYRPAFTRDMKMNGPYFSEILLNAILSHSMRWCKDELKITKYIDASSGGTQFFDQACSGLFNTLKAGNGQIPIVQSLLLLSAQECGRGNTTQAWVYSGMAFRLVEDLGITIDSRKYSGSVQFSDEDIEVRNRLFWSCYFWDKLVSLYFGRSPIIQDTPVSPPRILLDDTAEIEIWTPHGIVFPEGTHYPPTQAYATSCFMKMCSLTEILNQIIIHVYDPIRKSTEAEFQTCVGQQSRNLEEWWDELPVFLKLIVDYLPPYSPPSHIVTLNCVYHTTNILLHRPTLCSRPFRGSAQVTSNAKPLVKCISSATSIITLFDLYRRTFGDGHVVLSLAYSIYTAASIFLLEMQALRYASPSTLDKLRFCIAALTRVTASNPVIKTALKLIEQELEKLGIDIRDPSADAKKSHNDNSTNSPSSSLPTSQSPYPYAVPSHGAFSFAPPPLTTQSGVGEDPFRILADADPSLVIPDSLKQEGVYDIAPELFEAFSYVEPLSANMGGEFYPGWEDGEGI
ncbi:C6 transcription factor, variant [Blastomyces gilchristii SLH14081]|uniref:C6 transcription factor, variant n=1 Tax=Blastomyces gilchristii (strain SLH14081) TaxID=559298 RepID=A0A179UYJ2_BLAGS|nr:C6 transcription factor, variant [Blastomyces gilchristii SLH14081]OAT12177.1 C6 transcription factor, variant [Blastomyces gilchristii SLH14081]